MTQILASKNRTPGGDGFLEALEAEALEWLQVIRQYRVYEGDNPKYKLQAKTGIGIIGAYVRLRATMANETSNRLIERRMLGETSFVVGPAVQALPAAKKRD